MLFKRLLVDTLRSEVRNVVILLDFLCLCVLINGVSRDGLLIIWGDVLKSYSVDCEFKFFERVHLTQNFDLNELKNNNQNVFDFIIFKTNK